MIPTTHPVSHSRRDFLRWMVMGGLGTALAAGAGADADAASGRPNLTVVGPAYWGTLDFRKLADINEWLVATLIYSALVRNDDQFHPIPDLAQKWQTPDKKTYVFQLRRAKFHDGTDVTSGDVKATFDKLLDPTFGAPNRPLFAAIQAVEAPDSQTVIMRLGTPNPALMAFLAWVGIVPAHYAEQHPDQVATNPIGSGPV